MENVKGPGLGRGRGRGRGRPRTEDQQDIGTKTLLGITQPSNLLNVACEVPTVNQSESSRRPQFGRGRGKARHVDKVMVSEVVNQEQHDLSPGLNRPRYSEVDAASTSTFRRATPTTSTIDTASTSTFRRATPTTSTIDTHTPKTTLSLSSSLKPHIKQLQTSRRHDTITISHVLKKFLEVPKPSERVRDLAESTVKILNVLENGDLVVSFQDPTSLTRFNLLIKCIAGFYTSPEGFTLRKPDGLENGEIVAATVFANSDTSVFRRVKIQIVQGGNQGRIKAYGVDIDTLNHWSILNAFSLLKTFYLYPSQACPFRIANYDDMYPKGVFEILFDDQGILIGIMKKLSSRILSSLIGRNVFVSNITTPTDEESEDVFIKGNITIPLNLRLETLYVEAFCDYFKPPEPEEDVFYEGVITGVYQSAIVGICIQNSLYGPIDRILNTTDMHTAYQNVSDKDREELLERIRMRNCKVCIAVGDDDELKTRFLRVKIRSFYENMIKGLFMETGKETLIDPDKLICGMTNNPNVPAILALLPPQALRCQLAGIRFLSEQTCNNICTQYGNGIKFKVSKNQRLQHDMPEVEIFQLSASPTCSLNSVLNQSKGII